MVGGGKPVHPAFTHWPFAFLTLAYALDIVQPIRNKIPAQIESALPAALELQRISYYALSLGLITSVPAVLSGIVQGLKAVGKGGLWAQDGSIRPKVLVLASHALLSDAVILASFYVWNQRSRYDVALIKPEWERAGIAVALFLALATAASFGGKLTYEFGMGMSIGSASKNKKA